MASNLAELRVEVHKLGQEFFAAVRDENGREIYTNQFQHNPTGLTHLGPLWLLERGMLGPSDMQKIGTGVVGQAKQGQVALYGRRLYEYLFGNGKAFHKFVQANPTYEHAQMRLALHADAATLWRLPWEYMHDGETFLCIEGQVRFSRAIEGLRDLAPPPTPLPLCVLVVIPSPNDEEPLDVERELAVIMAALHDPACGEAIQMDVLSDATLPALLARLQQKHYHGVHYIGHGKYSSNQKGYLCFENASGETHPVAAPQLKAIAELSHAPRFIVLSACQSAQIGVLDAFDNVATGLLQAGVPAVLTMPTSLQDESAIALSRTLYSSLADGKSLSESVFLARQALQDIDRLRPEGQRRFDWGVPALYSRASQMQIIDPALAPLETEAMHKEVRAVEGLPVPCTFVGRRQQLQALRSALREQVPVLYLWGVGGIGKSTLAAQLIEQPGIALDGTLVIHCQAYPHPIAALETIAAWWREKDTDAHRQAAALLLDARYEPVARARRVLQLLADWRYLFVFDNIDAWFVQDEIGEDYVYDVSVAAKIADDVMRDILLGLASGSSSNTLLLTGRQRWQSLETVPQKLEIQVPVLSPHHAILLMDTFPHLGQLPLEKKQAVLQVIGGHPLALALLDGWLVAELGDLDVLLQATEARTRMAEAWLHYFLDALLDWLDPGEYDVLMILTAFGNPFCTRTVAQLTEVLESQAGPLLEKWHQISLITLLEVNNEGTWYTLHAATREHILRDLSYDERRLLHTRVAAYYGAPFVDEARRQVTSRSATAWSEARIGWLARSENGVLGMWVRQTQDTARAHASLQRALAWYYHLFTAGETEAAAQIAKASVAVLMRWGHGDYARDLLRRSVATLQGRERAAGLDTLAQLDVEIGRFEEALQVYEEVFQMLKDLDAQEQMAYMSLRIAGVQQRMGHLEQASKRYQQALTMMRQRNDEKGQGLCLRRLTGVCRQQKEHQQALGYSQSAKMIYSSLGDIAGMAAVAYEQGLIYKELGQTEAALDAFHEGIEAARSIGDALRVAKSMEEVAKMMQAIQEYEAAARAWYEALRLYQQQGDQQVNMIAVLESLGKLYEEQGDQARAMRKYIQARQLAYGQQ